MNVDHVFFRPSITNSEPIEMIRFSKPLNGYATGA
jgi:hypothetical protein